MNIILKGEKSNNIEVKVTDIGVFKAVQMTNFPRNNMSIEKVYIEGTPSPRNNLNRQDSSDIVKTTRKTICSFIESVIDCQNCSII